MAVNKNFVVKEFKETYLYDVGNCKIITGRIDEVGNSSDDIRIIVAKKEEEKFLLCICMETYDDGSAGNYEDGFYIIQDLIPFLETSLLCEVDSDFPPYCKDPDNEDYSDCYRKFTLLTKEEYELIKNLFFDEKVKMLLS